MVINHLYKKRNVKFQLWGLALEIVPYPQMSVIFSHHLVNYKKGVCKICNDTIKGIGALIRAAAELSSRNRQCSVSVSHCVYEWIYILYVIYIYIHTYIQTYLRHNYIITMFPSCSQLWATEWEQQCVDRAAHVLETAEAFAFTVHNKHPFYRAVTWISSTGLHTATEVTF